MPLVKVKRVPTAEWENMARDMAGLFPGTSVWRWDAAAARWAELPCSGAEWFLHDLAGTPLPGAPPGPLHLAVLYLPEGSAVAELARTTFAVYGGDGRVAEVVGIDPASRPRKLELDAILYHTPEELAELRRIDEEPWLPFLPRPEMKRQFLRDLGARFDLSKVRSLL